LGYGAFGVAAGCQTFADNTIVVTIDIELAGIGNPKQQPSLRQLWRNYAHIKTKRIKAQHHEA
jgi:hypothetical protein